jgi:hypothetical protein
MVTCFLTGEPISIEGAVEVTLHLGHGAEEELQSFYTTRERLKALVHPSIPLHPALTDADW